MGRLLRQAASPENIHLAWKRTRRDKAVWQPGLSKNDMMRNLELHLMEMAEELRTNTYVPDPVRFFPVEKGDGKQRIISANTCRDKVAQRAVLNAIEPVGERMFHPDSYGYRPGRSVDMASAKAREYVLCGLEWIVDADIQSYFDMIPHKPLFRMIKSLIPDRELADLIRRWLDAGAVRRGFLATARGIPQGAVLSPFLCNVYLTPWDNEMSANNIPFVRFADDFLLFASCQKDAEKALAFTGKTLERMGLALNLKKTRGAKSGPKIRFLGRKLPERR